MRAHARGAAGDPSSQLLIGPYRVVCTEARVFQDDDEVRLTSRERAVLEALTPPRGSVLSRHALEEPFYAFDDEIAGNAVGVYVSRLRAKLGPGMIETRREATVGRAPRPEQARQGGHAARGLDPPSKRTQRDPARPHPRRASGQPVPRPPALGLG